MTRTTSQPGTRIALRGDLLDFGAEPAWGDVDSPAVRYRPDHWLLIDNGRIERVQAEEPDASWQRHDHRGRRCCRVSSTPTCTCRSST